MSTEQVLIRRAGEDEVAEVRAILDAANRFTSQLLGPAVYERYRAMVLDIEGRLPHAQLLVAERAGQVVGTVTFFPDARDEGWGLGERAAGIRSLAVSPAAQGGGVGAALVGSCVDRARTIGASAVTLHSATFLAAAIRLYERYGFRRDPEHDRRGADLLGCTDEPWDEVALAYRLDLT